MRLIIVRHADPDYEKDSLTEKGWKEASLLAERIAKLDVKEFYVSPLGRAKDTASLSLRKMGRTATECPWLREFDARVCRPDITDGEIIAWDWLPQDWTTDPNFYEKDTWWTNELMMQGSAPHADTKGVYDEYKWVVDNFDILLSQHGYVRDKNIYRAVNPNRDTIVLFCHFGVECVLLSHLMNVSPMILWHHTCAAPSSVTTIYTEERRDGIASFRMSSFGDISHLYVADEEPAFAARFCETYDSEDERHD